MTAGEVVLASFPLVGERYRFKRILPGKARPAIAVTYVSQRVVAPVRCATPGIEVLCTGKPALAAAEMIQWVSTPPPSPPTVATCGWRRSCRPPARRARWQPWG